MKNHLTCLMFSLFALSVAAQKKKTLHKTPPPPKKEILIQASDIESTDQKISDYGITVAENLSGGIIVTKMNDQEIQIDGVERFKGMSFSELKKIVFTAMVPGKSLDNAILQKIVSEATQLEILEISNYTIENFPEVKNENHKLKKLILLQNSLTEVPPSISNFVALENFNSSNPLKELPETFSQLKNLKELVLNYTEFSGFPKAVFGLNKLIVLHISGNPKGHAKITELPDLFQQLPQLKEFGVTEASLSVLPKSFSALKKLEKASFSSNNFDEFPEVLAVNSSLEYVPFTDNPLNWDKFKASVKKIKWRGLFFLNETGLTKKQYEEIQQILSNIDVYYDGMD